MSSCLKIAAIAALVLLDACWAGTIINSGTYCGFLPTASNPQGMSTTITVTRSQWLTLDIFDLSAYTYYADSPFSHCTVEGYAAITTSGLLRVAQQPANGFSCYKLIGDTLNPRFPHPGVWNTSGAIPNATYANATGFTFIIGGKPFVVSNANCLVSAIPDNTYCSTDGTAAVMLQVKKGSLGIYIGDTVTGNTFAFEDQTTGTVPSMLQGDTIFYFPNATKGLVPIVKGGTVLVNLTGRRQWRRNANALVPPCPAVLPAGIEPVQYNMAPIFGASPYNLPAKTNLGYIRPTDSYCYGVNVPASNFSFDMIFQSDPKVVSYNSSAKIFNWTMSQVYFVDVVSTLTNQCPVFSGKFCGVIPKINVSVSYMFDGVKKNYHRDVWSVKNAFPYEPCLEDAGFSVLSGVVMTGGVSRTNACGSLSSAFNFSLGNVRLIGGKVFQDVIFRGSPNVTTIPLDPNACIPLPDGQYSGATVSGAVQATSVVYTDPTLQTQYFTLFLSNATTGQMDCNTIFFVSGGTAVAFGGSVNTRPPASSGTGSSNTDSSGSTGMGASEWGPGGGYATESPCNAAISSLQYNPKTKSITITGMAASDNANYGSFTIVLGSRLPMPKNTYCGYLPGVFKAGAVGHDIGMTLRIDTSQWYTLNMFFTDKFTPYSFDGVRQHCSIEGYITMTQTGIARLLPLVGYDQSWCPGILYDLRKVLYVGGLPMPTYAPSTGFTFALKNLNGSSYKASLTTGQCSSRVQDGIFCSSGAPTQRQEGIRVRSTNGYLTLYDGNTTNGNTYCFNDQTSGTVVGEISGDCDVTFPNPLDFKPIAGGGIQFAARRLVRQLTYRNVSACPAVLPPTAEVCYLYDFDSKKASIDISGTYVANAQLVFLRANDTFCYSTTAVATVQNPPQCSVSWYGMVKGFIASTKTFVLKMEETIYRDIGQNLTTCPVFTGQYCGVLPGGLSLSVNFDGASYTRYVWSNLRGFPSEICQEVTKYFVLSNTIMTGGIQTTDACGGLRLPYELGPMRVTGVNVTIDLVNKTSRAVIQQLPLQAQACTQVPNGPYIGTSADGKVFAGGVVSTGITGKYQQLSLMLSKSPSGPFLCDSDVFLYAGTNVTFGGTPSSVDDCNVTFQQVQYNNATKTLTVNATTTSFGSLLLKLL